MGIMNFLMKTKPADMSASQVSTGEHKLSNAFISQTDPSAINPVNGDRFVQKNFRSLPVCTEARGFTAQEADAMEQLVEMSRHRSKHAVRAFRAMGRNESADATVQEAHRQYLGAVAGAELRKVKANAQLGQTLHRLRPEYAKLGLNFQDSERSANNRVACLKAKIAGRLN